MYQPLSKYVNKVQTDVNDNQGKTENEGENRPFITSHVAVVALD